LSILYSIQILFFLVFDNFQPSAISHQPSAISHQPSAISHQPSAISHQPSANVIIFLLIKIRRMAQIITPKDKFSAYL